MRARRGHHRHVSGAITAAARPIPREGTQAMTTKRLMTLLGATALIVAWGITPATSPAWAANGGTHAKGGNANGGKAKGANSKAKTGRGGDAKGANAKAKGGNGGRGR